MPTPTDDADSSFAAGTIDGDITQTETSASAPLAASAFNFFRDGLHLIFAHLTLRELNTASQTSLRWAGELRNSSPAAAHLSARAPPRSERRRRHTSTVLAVRPQSLPRPTDVPRAACLPHRNERSRQAKRGISMHHRSHPLHVLDVPEPHRAGDRHHRRAAGRARSCGSTATVAGSCSRGCSSQSRAVL
jgi:hypothetical protein